MIFQVRVSENFQTASNKIKSGYCVRIRRNEKDKGIEFMIGSILPRSIAEDIKSSKQFLLLTEYLNYKGEEYQDALYKAYVEVHQELEDLPYDGEQTLLKTYTILYKVFDLFDYEDIVNFITNVYKLKPLSILPDEFNEQTKKDDDGTREQTYTKTDYLELASLVVIIKGTFMLIGHLTYLREGGFRGDLALSPIMQNYEKVDKNTLFKQLYLYYFRHDLIGNIPPFVKLKQYVEKLYYNPKHSEEELLALVIKRQLSDDEIIETLVAQSIFHKLAITSVVDDNEETYIVNSMFKFITNKINPEGKKSQTSVVGKPISFVGGDREERESHFEIYMTQTDHNPGAILFVNWCFETIDRILPQLHPEMRELILKGITVGDKTYSALDIRDKISESGWFLFDDLSILLVHPIFKGVMDPRYFSYLERDNVFNLMALAIVYLWNLGYEKLSVLVASKPVDDEEKMLTINMSTGRSRIPQEVLEKLYEIFPLYTINKKDNEKTYNIRKDVELIANTFYRRTWSSLLQNDISAYAYGGHHEIVPMPEDLRTMIANFLIDNEKYAYRNSEI